MVAMRPKFLREKPRLRKSLDSSGLKLSVKCPPSDLFSIPRKRGGRRDERKTINVTFQALPEPRPPGSATRDVGGGALRIMAPCIGYGWSHSLSSRRLLKRLLSI